eukprot:294654_1
MMAAQDHSDEPRPSKRPRVNKASPQIDLHKMTSEEFANWLQSGPVPEAAGFVRENGISGEQFYSQLSFRLISLCAEDHLRGAMLLEHILSVTENYREKT